MLLLKFYLKIVVSLAEKWHWHDMVMSEHAVYPQNKFHNLPQPSTVSEFGDQKSKNVPKIGNRFSNGFFFEAFLGPVEFQMTRKLKKSWLQKAWSNCEQKHGR